MMDNKTSQQRPFGIHLMLDMYNCPQETLDDKQLVFKTLKTLPGKIGMKILLEPQVVFAQPNGKRDPGGWTGFVLLQESHLTIHTFIKRKFATIDVYSCSDFNPDLVVNYLKKIFKTNDFDSEVELRGKKYPGEDLV